MKITKKVKPVKKKEKTVKGREQKKTCVHWVRTDNPSSRASSSTEVKIPVNRHESRWWHRLPWLCSPPHLLKSGRGLKILGTRGPVQGHFNWVCTRKNIFEYTSSLKCVCVCVLWLSGSRVKSRKKKPLTLLRSLFSKRPETHLNDPV